MVVVKMGVEGYINPLNIARGVDTPKRLEFCLVIIVSKLMGNYLVLNCWQVSEKSIYLEKVLIQKSIAFLKSSFKRVTQ